MWVAATARCSAEILRANHRAQGILFDLPRVVADAGAYLQSSGVADRCTCVGGDFFEEVRGTASPAGAEKALKECRPRPNIAGKHTALAAIDSGQGSWWGAGARRRTG